MRVFPDRRAGLAGVLHHDAESHLAALLECRAQHPDAGRLHLHDRVHALGYRDRQDFDLFWIRDRIAVHGDDPEGVAGQREDDVLGSTGVQQAHQDLLALLDAERFAGAEAVLVDGGVRPASSPPWERRTAANDG